MQRFKIGDTVYICGNVALKRSDGRLKRLSGCRAKIVWSGRKCCKCDIGIGKTVTLPKENLRVA